MDSMRKSILGLVPGLIALAVYYLTTCRSIWIGDSGEFALALDSLGICHPPGYPLFTLLGRLFTTALPFMRPIMAGGIYNTIVAASAVVVLYHVFARSLSSWLAGALSLVFAFSPVFWEETAGVEIYTLNVLLVGLTFLSLESSSSRKWLMTIYLFGLSLTNHPSALSLAPALVYLFVREKGYRNWKLLPIYLILIAVAGSVYLYLLVRSSSDPISDWGNPETIEALINHMTLKQYSGWVHTSLESFLVSVRLFVVTLFKSWWWIGIAGVVLGTISGWKAARPRTISALLILSSSLLLASSHLAVNYEPFYLVPSFASLLLISNNLIWLRRRGTRRVIERSLAGAGYLCVFVLLIVNFRAMDKSEYTLAEDYGKLILDTAGAGVLFTAGDINSFPTLYLRYSEGYRSAVEVYDRSIRKQALLKKARSIVGSLPEDFYRAREAVMEHEDGQIYFAKCHYVYEPEWLNTRQPLASFGILYRVGNESSGRQDLPEYPPDYDPGDPLSRNLLVNLDLARAEEALDDMPPDSAGMRSACEMALHRMQYEPRALLLNQIGIYFRQAGQPDLALEAYRMSLEKPLLSPDQRRDIYYNISNVHKDMGNAFLSAGQPEKAVASYVQALEYDPDNSRLLRNIGLIYLQELDSPGEALNYLRRYVEQNPSDRQIRDLVESLGG